MPGVARNAVVPPDAELWDPAVLRIEFQRGDLLKWILVGVPLDTNVVHRLFVEVLKHLGAEGVLDLVLHVEVTGVLGENVDLGNTSAQVANSYASRGFR